MICQSYLSVIFVSLFHFFCAVRNPDFFILFVTQAATGEKLLRTGSVFLASACSVSLSPAKVGIQKIFFLVFILFITQVASGGKFFFIKFISTILKLGESIKILTQNSLKK